MKKESRENLGIYLQDHYTAAVGAVELLEHLSATTAANRWKDFSEAC